MRATKEMFNMVVNEISDYMGKQLYLVPCSCYMFLSPVNNVIDCQRNFYLCIGNSISNANFDRLTAFRDGVKAVLGIR